MQLRRLASLFILVIATALVTLCLFIDDAKRLDNLLVAQAQLDDPFISAEIIRVCLVIADNDQCDISIVKDALNNAPNERNVLLNAVYFFASHGSDEEVIQSIQKLGKTDVFVDHSSTIIEAYVQSLDYANIGTVSGNIISAIGIEAAQTWPGSSIINWCDKNIHSTTKIDACLAFFSDLEKQSKLVIWQLIALEYQERIYEKMGNDNLAEETAARLRNSRASISENLNTEANNLLSFNEKLTRDWVKNRKELGELIAFTILKEDAIFLSQGPKSIVCGE